MKIENRRTAWGAALWTGIQSVGGNRVRKPIWTCLVLMFALLGWMAPTLAAQQESRASLGGRVLDQNGAAVQGAVVVVTAVDSGVKNTVKTNVSGDWTARYLNPGPYQFEVSATGFKTLIHPVLTLVVADARIIDTHLEVGSALESVTVTGETPLLDMTASTSGTLVDSSVIDEIPSASNAPTQLFRLTPGAVGGSAVGGTGVYLWSNGGLSGGSISGAGSGNLAINYTIDGAVDSQNGGSIAFEPPSDAVAEFKVQTHAYDASIGRSSAGVVNVDMKSGTSDFHGDVYENNYTNFLNARYYNTGTNPPVHNNQYGGSFGGPVWIPKFYDGKKEKTFFFYTFAGIRNRQPGSTGYMSLPTKDERNGDYSASYQVVSGTTYPTTVYDPLTYNSTTGQRTAFAGNVIPTARESAFAKAIFALMPQPDNAGDGANSDSNNYLKRELQDDKFAGQTLRVDQSWQHNQHTYATLRWNNWSETSYDPFGAANVLNGIGQTRNNKGMTLDHTIPLTQNLLADVRFNVTRYTGVSFSTSNNTNPANYGVSSTAIATMFGATIPEIQGIALGYENGGMGTAQGNSYTADSSYTLDTNLVYTRKTHTLRYGIQYVVQQQGNTALNANGGVFNFGSSSTLFQNNKFVTLNPDASAPYGTGFSVAGFYLGLPGSGSITNPAKNFWSQRYFASYFQDDWRANSKLTLNMGLRWDVERPMTERNNAFFSVYDPTAVNSTVSNYAASGYASLFATTTTNTGAKLIQQYGSAPAAFTAKGAIHYAGAAGTSRQMLMTRFVNFQPRVGFAYQLFPKTVIRGGAGRFVQPSFITGNQLGYQQTTTMAPTQDNYHTIHADMSNPFPDGIQSAIGNTNGTNTDIGSVSYYYDQKRNRVHSDQMSLSVEQQYRKMLFEVTGVYSVTSNMAVTDPRDSSNEGYQVNNPSAAAYVAAYTPTFDSTGKPVTTLAGDTQVTNPFFGAPNVISGTGTSSKIGAYQLIRPNPVVGNVRYLHSNGREHYYGLETKVERRFENGLSFIQAFSWSKQMADYEFVGRQVMSAYLVKQIDSGDRRFKQNLSVVYELPVGKSKWLMGSAGRLMNGLIGGYEVSGIYTMMSGTPISLPTNTVFFQGGDPGAGVAKTRLHQFNTDMFRTFPGASVLYSDLSNTTKYPTWTGVTGMAGAGYVPTASEISSGYKNGVYQDFATWNTFNKTRFGSVRNPRVNNIDLGVRKRVELVRNIKLQLRMDLFNALNHPLFGSVDTTPSDTYFGAVSGTNKPTQINAPRQIQLSGKITF